jgi:polysaccharide biosynthesis transport protein
VPTAKVTYRDLIPTAAAAAYSFRRTPVYESTASVLVRAITTNAFDPGQRVDQQLNMFNQRQLALSEPVAAVAAKHLGTTATPQQLVNHASADVPANSQIVRINYRDTVPQTAQRGAEAFATAYLAFREAEARAQAKSSQSALQKDIDRLRREVDQAEATVAAATSTPEAIRPPRPGSPTSTTSSSRWWSRPRASSRWTSPRAR